MYLNYYLQIKKNYLDVEKYSTIKNQYKIYICFLVFYKICLNYVIYMNDVDIFA